VTEAREEGIGAFVGSIFDESTALQGYTSDQLRLEFIAAFVQSLPYALDPISTGFRDYSRYPAETLVDAKGDCVDTSILLCVGLLESAVDCEVAFFSYSPEAVRASEAGHLAVGVAPAEVTYRGEPFIEARGRQYYYVEPTGFFKPGRVPQMIDFSQTEIHHIG